ncbi:MAG: hypothetical protein O7J95_22020 [Planctomycetota bacterium]|nr:hypothetical protein [Planctomycetota bacterium]
MTSLRWFVALVAPLGMVFPLALAAQDLGQGGLKENLDLPFDARGEHSDEEEDPPEVVIFYGQNYEGDGFFYIIDRSTTMQDRGELRRAKQEVARNVSEFSPATQFAIVFFDAGITKFPTSGRPAEAKPGMKVAALSWIANMPGGRGSCMMQGVRVGLQFANLSNVKRKVLVYVGDGGGTCSASQQGEQAYLRNMVNTITSQNYQRVQINCVGVLMGGRGMQEGFLKQLASANRGTYRQIN